MITKRGHENWPQTLVTTLHVYTENEINCHCCNYDDMKIQFINMHTFSQLFKTMKIKINSFILINL